MARALGSVGTRQTLPGELGAASQAHTLTALPLSVSAAVSVPRSVFVSLWTVGLASISRGRGIASEEVDSDEDGFEVRGVDAAGVLAEVVDGESVRDSPDEDLVGDSVRSAFPVSPEAPVAVAVVGSKPFPAIRRPPHFRQEPSFPIHVTVSSTS